MSATTTKTILSMIPRLPEAAVALLALVGLAACKTSNAPTSAVRGDEETSPVSTTEGSGTYGDSDNDLTAYAAECKAELGISGDLPDMNCLNGTEVPITIDGVRPTAETFPRLARGELGCDRAQWLDGECWTYDIVQRITIPGNDKIEGVLNCRQKTYTNELGPQQRMDAYRAAVTRGAPAAERLRLWRMIYEFDDLGLILRNKDTGKTCFFTFFGGVNFDDPARSNSFYGGWIPAPDKSSIPARDVVFAALPEPKPPTEYADSMWHRGPKGFSGTDGRLQKNMFFTPAETAGGGCVGCHAQGAFKHSPFIDQAQDDQGRIVPANPAELPYLLVGNAFQASFRASRVMQIDTEEVATSRGGEMQECTQCHAMSRGGEGNQERVTWAVGRDVPRKSTWASAWPNAAWMRPSHRRPDAAAFADSFGKHIEMLQCCINNPDARGCRKRAVGPTVADVTLANGLLQDDSWINAPETATASCVVTP